MSTTLAALFASCVVWEFTTCNSLQSKDIGILFRNWHRVGFVWDGSNRILYIDDAAVIEDILPELVEASGGLRIGASSNLDAGRFWSGMIDDVRIYDRVVEP